MKLAATLSDLSPRLQEVALLVSQGLTTKEITEETQLTFNTVHKLVYQACKRAGVSNRVGLAIWVRDHSETPRDRIFLAFLELNRAERETVIAELVEIHQRKED